MRIRDAITGALANLPHHRPGKCTICGRLTVFVCIDVHTVRNNMQCLFCHGSSRHRHVAKVLLQELAPSASSIRELPRKSNIRIYSTDSTAALARVLRGYDGSVSSGLFPGREPGEQLGERVYNQNLESLTFADESFDVVVSEDVFEHVRRDHDGFREVWRVLKPGGCHIFTVPCRFDRPTLTRVDTSGKEDVHLLPPEYHGDKIRGRILAYRTYGIDLYDTLAAIGFETAVTFSSFADRRQGIFDSYVFTSKKTA